MFTTKKIRQLYYVMDKNEDWMVKGHFNDHELSFTCELDAAYHTYSKDRAFNVSDECNNMGMNTKVVCILVEYSMWNSNVDR